MDRLANLRTVSAGHVARCGGRARRARPIVRHAARDLGKALGCFKAPRDFAFFTTDALTNHAGRRGHGGRSTLQGFGGLRDGRKLLRHALDGLDERAPQIGDVHRRGQLARKGRNRENVLPAVAVLLVMLQFQGPDDLIAELERHDYEALHVERSIGDAFVARHVVDDHRLTVCRDVVAERIRILGRLAPPLPAPGGTVHEGHLTVVQAINAEIAPIHEPVRQPFDALEGILETDIRRNHRFHRVDLIELLGGNRFLDHLLEQQTEEREDETHEQPRSERPRNDRADEDRRGEQRRRIRDDFVADDHQSFGGLELRADDQADVEQHATEQEVRNRISREGRKQLDIEHRCARHVEPIERGRVHAIGRDNRDDFAAEIDPGDAHRFPLPQGIRHHRRGGEGKRRRGNADEQAPGEADERRLRQIGILAQRNREPTQGDGRAKQHDDLGDLSDPTMIGDEHRNQQRRAEPGEGLAVDRDEPGDAQLCTAAANSRASCSAALTPPWARASMSALPTTTPSA